MVLEPSHFDGITGYGVGTGKMDHHPWRLSFGHRLYRVFIIFREANFQPIVPAKKIPVVLKPTILDRPTNPA